MASPLAKAVEGYTPAQLMALTETMMALVRADVIAGKASKEDIRAYNDARKTVNECKQLGMGA
jgi:hypothetical protein